MKEDFITQAKIEALAKAGFETPFYIYDEGGIQESAKALNDAFAWAPNYQNCFAVKAAPTDEIVRIPVKAGHGLDCSSMGELVLAENIGVKDKRITLTANNAPATLFAKARELGALINLDDISEISTLLQTGPAPQTVFFRWNPGNLKSSAEENVIGEPHETKFGVPTFDLVKAYKTMQEAGTKEFGLHMMVGSNMTKTDYLVETAELAFRKAAELVLTHHIPITSINLGGGFGIPYKPDSQSVDLTEVSHQIQALYNEHLVGNGINLDSLKTENGRFVTGPHGYLVGKVTRVAQKWKPFVGLDTGIENLLRAGIYESAHHPVQVIRVSTDKEPTYEAMTIHGSLCEGNDTLAKNRIIEVPDLGDYIVIGQAGAHGLAMRYNYNAKLACAEFIERKDGSFDMVRRAETLDDYRATILPLMISIKKPEL